MLPLSILVIFAMIILPSLWSSPATSLSYTDFLAKVDSGQVMSVTIDDQGSVSGSFRDRSAFTSQIPTALSNAGLEARLAAKNVRIAAEKSSTDWGGVLLVFLPVLLLIGFFVWSGRQAQRSLAGGVPGFGRSKTKIIEEQRPTTRFADVAGYEGVKQEISEIVDFCAIRPSTLRLVRRDRAGSSWLARRAPARHCSAGRWPVRPVCRFCP